MERGVGFDCYLERIKGHTVMAWLIW
jgi:hypothetical protein